MAGDPILVVGLGNPGSEYDETRHNIGFRVIDAVAQRTRHGVIHRSGNVLWTSARIGSRNVILAKPLTYMNNSGIAVSELLSAWPTALSNLLVVYDDLALPLGVLRMRPKGSHGGHNGMYSIISHVGSTGFPRLRCGIRPETPPRGRELVEFVLSPFAPVEKTRAETMIEQGAEAVEEFVRSGIERTMTKFNT